MQKVIKFNTLRSKYKDITSFFFDMDGTLMRTEFLHAMAINRLIEEMGQKSFDLEVLESICIGLNDEIIFNKLKVDQFLGDLDLKGFLKMKTDIFNILLREVKREEIFHEGVLELLKEIKTNGHKLALVTSSEKETTHELLSFLELTQYFDLILTREDTQKNKPHPEPYLKAMETLNSKANDVLIFEDSKVGLKAAKDSKAKVFQVKWYA